MVMTLTALEDVSVVANVSKGPEKTGLYPPPMKRVVLGITAVHMKKGDVRSDITMVIGIVPSKTVVGGILEAMPLYGKLFKVDQPAQGSSRDYLNALRIDA
jgi:hypothetical protein